MSEPFDYDELAAAGDDARKRKREDAMFPPRNLIIRLRWHQAGGHFHCRLFTAKASGLTYANCGALVFDEREWPIVKAAFQRIAEVLPEEE